MNSNHVIGGEQQESLNRKVHLYEQARQHP